MSAENRLKEKYGNDPGFRIPEGFFEEKFREISVSLPEAPAKAPAMRLTRWQRVRPYVYLAAMFAGIWCMMKMFHTMSSSSDISLDNPPAVVAEVMESSPEVMELYSASMSQDDYSLERSVMDEYDNFEDFENDFSIALEETERDDDFLTE